MDPLPNTKKLWKKFRPEDVFIEAVVSSKADDLNLRNETRGGGRLTRFVVKHDSELSSLNADLDISSGDYVANVSEISLPRVVKKFLPGQRVDFMSIDVEGHELEILRTNDFSHFRPIFLCVEILSQSIQSLNESSVNKLLTENNYSLISKLSNSFIYRDNEI
ncbi:FkbM family methyltransferase [Alphaproteobacteria bacterium]|nr:FkbM family methyltransferase [Alphaproteobacteria bacterium]